MSKAEITRNLSITFKEYEKQVMENLSDRLNSLHLFEGNENLWVDYERFEKEYLSIELDKEEEKLIQIVIQLAKKAQSLHQIDMIIIKG